MNMKVCKIGKRLLESLFNKFQVIIDKLKAISLRELFKIFKNYQIERNNK